MVAALKIISAKIGEGGQKSGEDVARVLQLLARARFLPLSASMTNWTAAATDACKAFHRSIGFGERSGFDPNEKSDAMLELCKKAKVVLPLKLGATGAAAFLAFWQAAVDNNVPYCWGGMVGGAQDRVAYGFDGYPHYLVFTLPNSPAQPIKFDPDPNKVGVAMNCISFVNLALAIWRTGCAHFAPYDANQQAGGFNPISNRYRMPSIMCPRSNVFGMGSSADLLAPAVPGYQAPSPLQLSQPRAPVRIIPGAPAEAIRDSFFYSSEDVFRVVQPGMLYYAEWCYRDQELNKMNNQTLSPGFGHHDTVLYQGYIYEINIPKPALQRTPLGARMNRFLSNTNALRIFGPV